LTAEIGPKPEGDERSKSHFHTIFLAADPPTLLAVIVSIQLSGY
jgi:hypothetical protein